MAPQESYKWSTELTRKLIRFRAANEEKFLKSRYGAKKQWEIFLKENGLDGIVPPDKASKKWENLKRKYKDLKLLKTGSGGTEEGEKTAADWQYFELMHEVLGSRPSVDPPVVVASFQGDDITTIVLEIVEPSTSAASSSTARQDESQPTASVACGPSPSPAPPAASPSPRKRKRKSNAIVDFLKDESTKEQKRHEESEEKSERFLGLFKQMVDKM